MAEGVVSRAFIMSNGFATSQSTVNISRSKVITIQKTENVVETKYKSVNEQEQLPPSGSQAFQYNLVEPSISVGTGTIVRVKNAVRTISEPAKSITESLNKKVIRAITEPAKSISENLVRVRSIRRILSEPAKSIGESLSKTAYKVRTISEPAKTIGESLA